MKPNSTWGKSLDLSDINIRDMRLQLTRAIHEGAKHRNMREKLSIIYVCRVTFIDYHINLISLWSYRNNPAL
ncbi:hypothetical protein HMPREF3113_12600 [Stenotrophomonas sp. HMSC10F06]|nr:hypothetical protein HMPREF3113_12600 [Stenotrophomonas sp. HMSC10F06]